MKSEGRVSSVDGQGSGASRDAFDISLDTRHSTLGRLAVITVLGLTSPAWGQAMTDPTRPPAGFAPGDPDAAAQGGPVLQSVMISASGSAAIISGEMVKLGQKYGDAVLVKVAESEVVLKGGSGVQVLKLYPGVEKRSSAPQTKAPARGGKRPPAAVPAPAPNAPGQGDS